MKFDYTKLIEAFESTKLYKEVISKLPSPLDNPVFSGIILLILCILLIASVIDFINGCRIRRRIKKKNREYEEKKLDDKIKQAEESAQNKEIEQCLKLMMVTQMQNIAATKDGASLPEDAMDIRFSPKDCTQPEVSTVNDFLKKNSGEV